jgi:hypothetical protein
VPTYAYEFAEIAGRDIAALVAGFSGHAVA